MDIVFCKLFFCILKKMFHCYEGFNCLGGQKAVLGIWLMAILITNREMQNTVIRDYHMQQFNMIQGKPR